MHCANLKAKPETNVTFGENVRDIRNIYEGNSGAQNTRRGRVWYVKFELLGMIYFYLVEHISHFSVA